MPHSSRSGLYILHTFFQKVLRLIRGRRKKQVPVFGQLGFCPRRRDICVRRPEKVPTSFQLLWEIMITEVTQQDTKLFVVSSFWNGSRKDQVNVFNVYLLYWQKLPKPFLPKTSNLKLNHFDMVCKNFQPKYLSHGLRKAQLYPLIL